jgi:signal transduction histidine kinase
MKAILTSLGLFIVLTQQLTYAQNHSPVTLKKVLINHVPDSQFYKKNIVELKALDDDVLMEFANNDSAVVSKDSFQFILENYDKQWTKSSYPSVRYTALSGGDYIFKAKWGDDDRTLITKKIHVERALSEEPWFYPSVISCILLILGAMFYFWSIYNLRQKLKIQTIRNHIASDLHDEVGSTLSSISISLANVQRKLKKTSPEIGDVLKNVREISEETNKNLRDTVWAINPTNDSIERMMTKMHDFAFQILQAKEMLIDYKNTVDTTKLFTISMDQRRNVFMMFKEAINNIARHSEATHATIHISLEKEGLRVLIADNGKGFSMEDNFDGNGLKNFRRRATESFIDLDVKSTPSVSDAEIPSGTTITMVIPEL